MNNLPKISIVTPSYNQGKFLRETIESVLNQDYPNLEYFIVDGGSTDNSVEIIREYEDRIDWWVSEKDEGQADAIAKGFERATGDLLGWLNSDDVYFPDALKKIGEAYAKFPEASLYQGALARGNEKGVITQCHTFTAYKKMFSRYGIFAFGQPSSFFCGNLYREIGGLNRRLHNRMDHDLIYRLMLYNHKAVVIDDIVSLIRSHAKRKAVTMKASAFRERDEFERSLDIPKCQLGALRILFKIYRLMMGSYFRSLQATHRYKGMRLYEIWEGEKSIIRQEV